MARDLRKTGLDAVGEVPWGTHFCNFYETEQDLLDTLVPYFSAGLLGGEFCLWIISSPLSEDAATAALRDSLPDLDRYLAQGGMEIISHQAWYLQGGTLDLHRVKDRWKEKLQQVIARGYEGMRVSGNARGLQKQNWRDFCDYEKDFNGLIGNQRMIVACSYPLSGSGAAEILDVVCTHKVAVAVRHGSWEIVETAELKQAKAELKKLNAELDQLVRQRTRELSEANGALRREITQRKKAEEALRESEKRFRSTEAEISAYQERLRSMASEMSFVEERERRKIATALHDQVGQTLALASIKLGSLRQGVEAPGGQVEEIRELITEAIRYSRTLTVELSSPVLYELGLEAAICSLADEYQKEHDIRIDCRDDRQHKPLCDDMRIVLFQGVRELLVNAVKHAHPRKITISCRRQDREIRIVVEDDGTGFDPAGRASRGNRHGFGLFSLRERLRYLGGSMDVESMPGSGTRVELTAPLAVGAKKRNEA